MGVIKTSKDQALLVTDSTKAQAKGRPKGKEHKTTDLKPKENQNTYEGASGFNKKKRFEKKKISLLYERFSSRRLMHVGAPTFKVLSFGNSAVFVEACKRSCDEK